MYLENMTKTCCESRYRMILTDIGMPVMDGCEAAVRILTEQKRLRQEKPELPEVIIVGITGYDSVDTFQKMNNSGIKDVLTKPINADQLKYIVEQNKALVFANPQSGKQPQSMSKSRGSEQDRPNQI